MPDHAAAALDRDESPLIIILDPDPDFMSVNTLYLSHVGYAVVACRSGNDALRAVSNRKPDVIITEHPMMVEDGYSLLRLLQGNKETANIRVIILTSWVSDNHMEAARIADADLVLTKPIFPSDLRVHIDQLLER